MRNLRKTKPMMWLMVLTMLVSMIGIVPMAAAAGDYSAMKVPSLNDDPDIIQALGGVKIVVDAGSLEDGDVLTIALPEDITLEDDSFDVVADLANDGSNCLYVPEEVSGGDPNGITADAVDFEINNDLDEIQLTLTDNGSSVDDAYMYLYLRSVVVEDGVTGDAVITFDAPANSGFSSGDVVVATIGSGDVTVTVTDEETSNSDFAVTIRVKENVAGALEVDDESLKFTLPDGFEWKSNSDFDASLDSDNVTYKWGEKPLALDVDVDEDELYLSFDGPETEDAACFEMTLQFEVADETDAELGDVLVKVGGETDIASDADLVGGIYGEYGGVVEVKGDVPTVYAGQTEQEIADIEIRELLADTFMENRTITLTLPEQARWSKVDDTEVDEDTEEFDIDSDAGDDLIFAGLTGDNDRTLKLSFDSVNDNDEAELLLENCEIAIRQGFAGEVKVTIGGSQGIDGEIVIANSVKVVSLESSSKPQVKIGLKDQLIGEFTITEQAAGSISDETPAGGSTVMLIDAPEGVQFSDVPKVEVVSGDLEIDEDNVTRQNVNNQVVIPIDDSSDVASVLKVTNIKLTIDRTVPEGDLEFKIQGTAVTETGPSALGGNNMWPNNASATSNMAATVITPAPGETTQTATFVIGSTEYKVGNAAQTMDVAPYIKGDRTYLPIRYVGYALGVAEQNILWDDASKTATLIMGDKVVQVKIGSTTMMVNGVAIAMDVAPEITDGRTMLPFRFIGQAFGADFTWDDATKTVTMNI